MTNERGNRLSGTEFVAKSLAFKRVRLLSGNPPDGRSGLDNKLTPTDDAGILITVGRQEKCKVGQVILLFRRLVAKRHNAFRPLSKLTPENERSFT